uniref:DNA topoisomerase 2-binding protein 1 n=1 Tax=Elaeophora elaphi TaxID=1147741 RepID=A0A0R3RPX7_9BILA
MAAIQCDSRIPPETAWKRNSSSENMEMVGKFQLWMLKAEVDEAIAGFPRLDELTHQEDLFQMLKEKSLNPKWITSRDCLERKFGCDDFYVLPVFRGEIFSHLISLKCRVYGTLALITCLKRKGRLPKRHSPVWSTTLQDSIVCFSGIEMKTRHHQISLVKMMGGTISKAFTKKVTHLVADSQDTESKKFVAAIDYKVPVLSVSWIFAAWKSAKRFNDAKYTGKQFVNEHKLQIFVKCVISCSGIAPQDRSTLSRLIEANGGVYTGNMKKNHCTHLVTDLNSGEKYKIARKWGWNQIRIVRLRWITKSVEKGYRLPERLYETRITSADECSTPRTSQLTQFQPLTNVEINISEDNKLVSSSTPQMHLKKNENIATEVNKSTVAESSLLKLKPSHRTMMEVDPIVLFDLDALRFNDFMSNCIIYLCGIEDENVKKYKWLTNRVGSGRRDRLVYTDTTHVVVGPQRLDWKLIKQLEEKARSNVKVVTCEWLLNCAKAQIILDESDYLIFKQEKSHFEISQHRSSMASMKRLDCSSEPATKTTLKITEVDLVGTKLLGKTIGMLTDAELDSAEEIRERSVSRDGEGGSSSRHLFTGLSFRIVVTKKEIRDKLFSDVESHGGKVEQKAKIWVDYMVCEVLDCLLSDNRANFNCGSVVSSLWLQECVEKGTITNAEKHPLYRPIEVFETSQIFTGHVVGLSMLSEAEKDIFTDILYKFGADVKNHLGQMKLLNMCTEIVIGAETDRSESARRLQIPVLDPSWIIESIIQNQLQPVQSHLFHDQSFKNYTRNDRLWMHATQRKPSSDKSNMLGRITNNDKMSIRKTLNRNEEKANPQYCGMKVLQQNSIQNAENMEINEDRILSGQNVGDIDLSPIISSKGWIFKYQHAQKNFEEQTSSNLAAVLDLTDAFAYVDRINTQNTLDTSRDREIWNDTAVCQALGEAVVKTAQESKAPWTSIKQDNDYNLMQTRQNKRSAESVSLIGPVESPKKARTTVFENHCESVISKDEKKKRVAEKLAKLAVQREQYMRSIEVEKEKQREQEKKTELHVPVESPKRDAKKRYIEPPEPEYYGWKESSPRPIATQILNPFDVDLEESNKEARAAAEEEQNQGNQMSTVEEYENAAVVKTPVIPSRIICFTSISQHDKNALVTMVQELGGEVCNEFGEKVTHLVCGRIVRNEKFLCSIAKGLIIVDEDYVICSHAQSKWLEVEDYEWGSAHSVVKHRLLALQSRLLPFALACPRWRHKIEKNPEKRAFHRWNVLLYCGRRRFDELKRIIHFGGGRAYLRDDICSLNEFTIALVEKSRFWNSQEVVKLIKRNIQCFDIDYLATYLTLENTEDVEKYFHKDYVAELKDSAEVL